MKKVLSMVLTMIMVFSSLPIIASASATGSPSDWAQDEIRLAKNAGIFTDAVTKDYQKNISREEFCELVIKLYEKLTDETVTAGNSVFTDTDNPEIVKAYNLGIVKGVSNNEFAPANNITRQEICVMLVRCIDIAIENADIAKFSSNDIADKNQIADWAIDYVNYAYDKGIMKGVGNNCINPLGNTTCEQAIMLAYRIYSSNGQNDTANVLNPEIIDTGKENGTSPDEMTYYRPVIEAYSRLLKYNDFDEAVNKDQQAMDDYSMWNMQEFWGIRGILGYKLYDIDHNGVKELLIGCGNPVNVYSIQNGSAVSIIDSETDRIELKVYEDNTISEFTGNVHHYWTQFYTLNPVTNELVELYKIEYENNADAPGKEYWYYSKDGSSQNISSQKASELIASHSPMEFVYDRIY